MRWFRRWSGVLRRWVEGSSEADLDAETRSYLELVTEEKIYSGIPRQEAERQARLEIGGLEQVKELVRESRHGAVIESIGRDVRQACRSLARSRGFTMLAVAILALGIGATTTVYSIVESVLVQTLPWPDSDGIVRLVEVLPPDDDSEVGNPTTRSSFRIDVIPDLNARVESISSLTGYLEVEMTVTGLDRPFRLAGARVSAEMFGLLGVEPALGRAFGPDSQVRGAEDVVVISDSVRQSLFGGQPDVLNRGLRLDGRVYRIIGVMPPGFAFPDGQEQFWTPLRPAGRYEDSEGILRSKGVGAVPVLARLKPGLSRAVAATEVRLALNEARGRVGEKRQTGVMQFPSLKDEVAGPIRPMLLVLIGAVAGVLLIAAANVAMMNLARTTARSREIAIRSALGASRRALLGPALIEGLLLAFTGGVAGTMLAHGAVQIVRTMGVDYIPRAADIGIHDSALAFTLAVSLVVGCGTVLAPALTPDRPANLIQERTAMATSGLGLLRRYRGRALMVVGQIAVTFVLLAGSGLLIHSFVRMASRDPGYDASHLLTFRVAFPDLINESRIPLDGTLTTVRTATAQNGSRLPQGMVQEFLSRMEGAPDVEAAGLMYYLPTSATDPVQRWGSISIDPTNPDEIPRIRIVSSGLFRAMGIGVIAGRGFAESDAAAQPRFARIDAAPAPRVLVVNRSFARKYFPGDDPVGMVVTGLGYVDLGGWEIIGVVEDILPSASSSGSEPEIFVHLPQAWDGPQPVFTQVYEDPYFVVRTLGEPTAAVPLIRTILEQVDPLASLRLDVQTMEERLWASIRGPRFYSVALGAFAASALMLATVGLYGLLAQLVEDSRRGIGIRMALGADFQDVLRSVMKQAAILAAIGMTAGLSGALGFTRLLMSAVYGLSPLDPVTFVGVSLLMLIVVAAAAWFPARRATRVDPLVTLRHE